MKELSRLAKNVNPSTTLAIDAMAKQMRADGLDVIGFGAGEPDFETPVNIQDVGVDAIRKGKTKYTPAAGIAELRRAAAARLKADCGLDYDWTQIVVASGAKHNVYVALAARRALWPTALFALLSGMLTLLSNALIVQLAAQGPELMALYRMDHFHVWKLLFGFFIVFALWQAWRRRRAN